VPAQIENTHFGRIVENVYLEMKDRYKNIKLHDYTIMLNHIHRIIIICDMQFRAGIKPAPTGFVPIRGVWLAIYSKIN
jgi:hypothetical protein